MKRQRKRWQGKNRIQGAIEVRLEELFLQEEEAKIAYKKRLRKQYLCGLAIAAGLIFLLLLIGMQKEKAARAGRWTRPDAQEGAVTERLSYLLRGNGEEIAVEQSLSIAPREYTFEEASAWLDESAKMLDEVVLGENASWSAVSKDLVFPDHLEECPVTISWEYDHDVFQSDGTLKDVDIRTEPIQTQVQAKLMCSGVTEVVNYPVTVIPPTRGREEFLILAAKEQVEQAEEAQRFQDQFVLPSELGAYQTVTGNDIRPWRFLLLLPFAAVGSALLFYERLGDEVKRRRQCLKEQYPLFVDQLLLFLQAGLSLPGAWREVSGVFQEKPQYEYLAREMRASVNELDNHVSMDRVLGTFAQRSGVPEYLRLSFLLRQNLQKGTKNLPELMSYEAREAREQRRSLLRQKGEETGTKLLFPMMIWLLVVLMILLVPAWMQL
ncbi:MAG: type II secretion system F family protein [Lachnospiraceae bacterium]|nr:type II secretion system F family protein [Lachnospiraceae bacterium]